MDTAGRHIHIVVFFLTVGEKGEKRLGCIATDTLHCPASQPALPLTKQTLSLLRSLCAVFSFFFFYQWPINSCTSFGLLLLTLGQAITPTLS